MNTHAPDLNELVRLAFSGPVTWLFGDPGEAGSRQAVSWICISLDEAQPGDLLLVPANQVSDDLFKRARSRDVSGILLLGKIPAKAELFTGNTSRDFPMGVFAGMEDIRLAQRILITTLVNHQAALMERGVRIHTLLSQMAAEGEGLPGLSRAMADISGKGVVVQDKRLDILADHPSSTLQTIWEDVIVQVSAFENLAEPLRNRKLAGSQAVVVSQKIPGGLERLVVPITVSGIARGYLSLIGMAGEIDSLDHLVAEQGGLVCAVEMARAKAVREAEKRLKGDLLTALLQDNLTPRDAQLWAQAMGLDLSMAYSALRFAWDGPSPPSRRRLETLVNGEVKRLGLTVITSPMGSEVVCFCPVASVAGRPEGALSLAQAVLDEDEREFPGNPTRCGVGTPCPDFSTWRTSFRQAGQALEMARRLSERRPLYFPDLSIYRLLMQFEHHPELIAFQEETLGPLLAHEGGQELIHTLEAYFAHNANLSQTAEALFLHRNTLIYRMERIASITGLDLDKPEARLALQLSLHINRMRGSG